MRPTESKVRYKTDHNPGQAIYPRTQKHYHYNIARLHIKQDGKEYVFELDVNPSRAIDFRHGKDIDMRDVLKVQRIFSSVSTATFAKNSDMLALFATDDVLDVAKVILQKGKILPVAEEENRLREEKRKRIIDVLRRCAVHAKTGEPLLDVELEKIMADAKVQIDLHESDSWTIRKIIEAVKTPLKVGMQTVQVTLAPQFIGKAKYYLTNHAKILKEETLADSSWRVTAEVLVGVKEEIFNYLNALTHGKFSSKSQ